MQDIVQVLYWTKIFGVIYEWQLAIATWLVIFIVTLMCFWKPWRFLSRRPEAKPPERFLRSLAISWWGIVMLGSISIWVTTVYNLQNRNWSACTPQFLGALFIVILTFALEGLETAYIDLNDKDPQQFAQQKAADQFRRINEMGPRSQLRGEAFLEAREWAIITLLVAATLMIDQKQYFIPFVAHVSNDRSPLLTIVRLGLTVALTTFALVWVAQSPGKYVARSNSVNFLSYYSSIFALVVLQIAWRILTLIGLQHPSRVTNELALQIMNRCKEKRNLLPSEFRFFADSLKKYGYGFLISDDTLSVKEKGEIEIISRTLFYVGAPRSGVKRRFSFEEGFEAASVNALRDMDPACMRCWAFQAPQIGEKVTPDDLKTWAGLFYSQDPGTWAQPNYIPVPTDTFKVDVVATPPPQTQSLDPDQRPLHTLELELSFQQLLPAPSNGDLTRLPQALLVLWEVSLATKPGAFLLPQQFGEQTVYPYFKKNSHPALRVNVVINLPELPGNGVIFINPEGPSSYRVTYDGILHEGESERFRAQHRTDPLPGAPIHPQGPRLGRKSVFYVDLPLPAAEYEIKVAIAREHPAKKT